MFLAGKGSWSPKSEGRSPKEGRRNRRSWRELGGLADFGRLLSRGRLLDLWRKRLLLVGFSHAVGQAGAGGAHVRVAREGAPLFGNGLATADADARLHSILFSATMMGAASAGAAGLWVRISRVVSVDRERVQAVQTSAAGQSVMVLPDGRQVLLSRGLPEVQVRLQYPKA